MTIAQSQPKDGIIVPQGEFWSDQPPLESNLHLQQIILLIKSLEWLWRERDDFFAAGDLTIYYSPNQKKTEYFRGPDFFVVLGTTPNPNRKSWVVWEENGQYPNIIVEILSDSTAKADKGEKKEIYQNIFRTPDYFWFDPYSLEFQGFTLISGKYQPIDPNEQGWLWSEQLGLYLGIYERQLRYFTPDGQLVPSLEEANATTESRAIEAETRFIEAETRAIEERQQKEYERQQKQLAEQKIAQLTAKLRELGVNPDENED